MRNLVAALAAGTAVAALAAAAQAAPDCKGKELTIGTFNPPFIGGPAIAHAKTWEQRTGGKTNVVTFPFGELYTKYMTPMATGQHAFDVIMGAPAWEADFAPYLSEMPAWAKQGADWDDIAPVYRERMMVLDGKTIARTIDGDVHSGSYRKDLFEDPKEKEAFKAKYGYDLAPPDTWKQYYDIAEFFTRPDKGLWGTAEAFVRGGQQFWFFFSHAASYTNWPRGAGAMFFDPDTMDAQLNNPGWERALEDYIHSSKVSPAGALNMNSGDIRTAFAGGQVAMNIDWGDTGVIAADPKQSKVAGHVGFFVTPGSDELYNYKTKQWEKQPQVIKSPFMAYGGWVAEVPASSQVQDCAWDYITWYGNPENSLHDVTTGGTGVNPYRQSHFTNVGAWTAGGTFDEAEAKNYLEVQRDSIDPQKHNVALDVRIPGYFQYTEVLEIELSKALAGDEKPQEALDSIAKQWNQLTDDLGRDKQLAAYRASMGLPPKK